MAGSNLFRKAALEKLSSPERLDVLMRVTSPAGWLALGAMAFLILAVVVWSVIGEIAIKVEGKGILMRGGAIFEIESLGSGTLLSIDVVPGDLVEAGQVIARISQPDLNVKIENTRLEIESLSGQGAQQSQSQRALLTRYRQQAAQLRDKIEVQKKLLERGLLTRTQLMQTQSQLTATEQSMANLRTSAAGRSNRLAQVRARLRELEGQLETLSQVRSPYSGRVLEMITNPGDLVEPGSRLVTLEDPDQALKAVVFIPAAEGKKIRKEMFAYVSPSTVRPEEYGFIIGKVTKVSEFPLTPAAVLHILGNRTLAEELAGRTSPIQVIVTLEEDPEAVSGFKWTSRGGPPTSVYSGTLCKCSVQVESKRPISYVIPVMKRTIGIS
ncbi:MAG: NHLP bacteriocin system secretion protein [Thermoanaerobaculales bacterium]